ncbi:hypothetical protein NicSoilB4_06610 [Arthrobacter sp. NicSoilB4]|uniref:hypothetical protein n=1 Tax=Arthrobacter sp. NicSoilB4 TaxID=2830997 RepID=UPI001CC42A5B|nr:hypothetical protein [Arthrobacter sp. NicSoilB4]BCW65898.1 hypothetical protein NicSoilB4_06610 [Arthrobacter sp. NicSoilB4]
MATLEWATLVVCCAALLLRVPDAVMGRNRTVFGILVLATLCSLLAVSELYVVIDGALGGRHVTSLILRYLVFATVLLVGLRITRGLAAARGYGLIAGATGRWVLALCCLTVLVTFLLIVSTWGPAGPQVASDIGRNASRAPYYTAAGRTYPAFVSLVLAPPLLATVRSRQPRLVRAGALLVLLGALFAILSLPASLAPAAWAEGLRFVNYAAVLGYVAGLAVLWFSGLISNPSGNTKTTLRRNHG